MTEPQGEEQPKKAKAKRKKLATNAPRFNLQQELQRVAGVDLTRIDGDRRHGRANDLGGNRA